jgi:hypothetical protein
MLQNKGKTMVPKPNQLMDLPKKVGEKFSAPKLDGLIFS